MKFFKRNSPGSVANFFTLWDSWGVKIVLNKYIDLSNTPIHNHKQNFFSLILWGGYFEYIYDENLELVKPRFICAPDIIHRHRNLLHLVECLPTMGSCWTLQVYYGKKVEQKVFSRDSKSNQS